LFKKNNSTIISNNLIITILKLLIYVPNENIVNSFLAKEYNNYQVINNI